MKDVSGNMKPPRRLASLGTVVYGNWLIKASSLDDQILIVVCNKNNVDFFVKMFYDEEVAFKFMESFYDKNSETHYG